MFILVFAGCGAIIAVDTFDNTLGHMGVSMVFGLAVMAMIYSAGNISGAHLNPAVTLGFWFAKRLDAKRVAPYIASQVAGALLAALALRGIFPEHAALGATLPGIGLLQAFIVKVTHTFVQLFVALNISTGHMEKGHYGGCCRRRHYCIRGRHGWALDRGLHESGAFPRSRAGVGSVACPVVVFSRPRFGSLTGATHSPADPWGRLSPTLWEAANAG